jgi:hypothetical protein
MGDEHTNLNCLLQIRSLPNFQVMMQSQFSFSPYLVLEVEDLRYGCTCGKCLRGFISPRMKFELQVQAGVLYDSSYKSLYSYSMDNIAIELMTVVVTTTAS